MIFHRKELLNKRYPFNELKNPLIEEQFNTSLLALLDLTEYKVVTVVIDKLEHMMKYDVWRYDPYHYCQEILVERFVLWLKDNDSTGDVLAESRGGKEDIRLKDSFEQIYETGSRFVQSEIFQTCLTTRQLKIKAKSNNIAGLQLADLIAHPSYKAILARKQNQALPENFGGQIAQILEAKKYLRSPSGKIDGWGRKLLP